MNIYTMVAVLLWAMLIMMALQIFILQAIW